MDAEVMDETCLAEIVPVQMPINGGAWITVRKVEDYASRSAVLRRRNGDDASVFRIYEFHRQGGEAACIGSCTSIGISIGDIAGIRSRSGCGAAVFRVMTAVEPLHRRRKAEVNPARPDEMVRADACIHRGGREPDGFLVGAGIAGKEAAAAAYFRTDAVGVLR